MKKVKAKEPIMLYKPKITVGNMSKYDLVLRINWGFFNKTVVISREYPKLVENVVDEINEALAAAVDSHPYETR